MKYKVGDRVKVREDLEYAVEQMLDYRGKIITIESVGNADYLADSWYWTDEMFSGLADELIQEEPTPPMKTDPNAPAYSYGYCTADGQCRIDESGLTKREYFAAMAMQGMLSCADLYNRGQNNVATEAVKYADALITELNKPKP